MPRDCGTFRKIRTVINQITLNQNHGKNNQTFLIMEALQTTEQSRWDELIPTDAEGMPKYINMESYRKLINHDPKRNWIAVNKYAGNSKYIPIGVVEELLREIFPAWEAKQVGEPKILGNSVVVSVELRVLHPILRQWLSYPGVGAVPIEVEKDAHPTDFTKINSKALHKNVPAALSYAINNAAKKIGRIFGAHLNRKDSEV